MLTFDKQGQQVTLHGLRPSSQDCNLISAAEVRNLLSRKVVTKIIQLCAVEATQGEEELPAGVQDLIQEFQSLFAEPKGLPPRRPYDHSIPLLPGAKPVNLKPYRYSPAQKDEIEKQVKEMLHQGVIQLSNSPFASPVLLVEKKDGSGDFVLIIGVSMHQQ